MANNKTTTTFKQRWKNVKVDFKIWLSGWLLNIGARLLRRGTLYQVGQPIKLPAGPGPSLTIKNKTVIRKKPVTYFIENIYFNFKQNQINYSWSEKPIKGYSERFATAKPAK